MIGVELIPSADLRQRDLRLDAGFYCSAGAKARRLLASSPLTLDTLESVCVPGGVYIPPRFKRPYVRDPEHGVPYLTGSDIVLADPLHGCAYLSRRPGMIPHKDRLVLRPGIILVTSSGDPGNAVYVNELFNGAVGSPDILRIVPDPLSVPPGYLFAFLVSDMGRGLLTQGTYGGVVPHIEAVHVLDLPLPRLNRETELAIHHRIEQAAAKRVQAKCGLSAARERVYEITGLPRYGSAPLGRNLIGVRTFTVSHSTLGHRLEARFHDVLVREMQTAVRQNNRCTSLTLKECSAELCLPQRGKWINVREDGVPLVSSGDMFAARPRASRLISMKLSPPVRQLIVEENDILLARSGQIYSILGDAVMVGRSLAGMAVTEDAIRVKPNPSVVHPGYLFAFLTLPDYGYGQLVRTAYGTSIPHLSVDDLGPVLVPIPTADERDEVGEAVLDAIRLRDEANELENEAQGILRDALALTLQSPEPSLNGHAGG